MHSILPVSPKIWGIACAGIIAFEAAFAMHIFKAGDIIRQPAPAPLPERGLFFYGGEGTS
jgi:hypothetical protein